VDSEIGEGFAILELEIPDDIVSICGSGETPAETCNKEQ
jgi:hypothetical protein